jgi:methionyl aminopeptidase
MLVRVTEEALNRAIDSIGPGVNLTEVGRVIEELVDSGPRNYGIVREFTGHGLGARLHMLPHVFHFKNQSDWILQPGTTLTIEPMLSEGSRHVKSWADGWTIATNDGGRSAQFEHVVLITEDGTEVLT